MIRLIRFTSLLFLVAITCSSSIFAQGITGTFPSSFVFFNGNVTVGKTVDKVITFKNAATSTGSLNITITGPSSSNFSVVGGNSFTIAAGQSQSVTVRFQPTAAGFLTDTLFVNHNADTSKTLKNPYVLRLFGTGVKGDTFPKIAVTTGAFGTSISFGQVTEGKTVLKTFTVKNVSDTIRTLTGSISSPSSARYTIISGGGPFSLDTGMMVTVSVQFKPDSLGTFSDSIIVTSNTDSTNKRIKVSLSGTGIKPDPFPKITITAPLSGINFRNDTIGRGPRTASFSIVNTSDSTRTLTGSLSNPNSPFSVVSGAGNFSLDSGKILNVQLAFTATAIGVFRDTLIITTNSDSANQLIRIPLVGTGLSVGGPHLTAKPVILDFGSFSVSGMVTLHATIKNLADSIVDTLKGSMSTPHLPFSISSGGGSFAVANGDSIQVSVSCSGSQVGVYSDSIVIVSNSSDNARRFVIQLHATLLTNVGVQDGGNQNTQSISATPNPLSTKTTLNFSMDRSEPVNLHVFDMLGIEVYHATQEQLPSGANAIEWSAVHLPNGSYLCVLQIGNETRSVRVVVAR